MVVDVQTAKAAGIPVWLVLPDRNEITASVEDSPDRVISSFAQLLNLLTVPRN
jgi:phosphoglycolate phosphatase-like HAD superfamily hydrolase